MAALDASKFPSHNLSSFLSDFSNNIQLNFDMKFSVERLMGWDEQAGQILVA
jgi:hypothetical protein